MSVMFFRLFVLILIFIIIKCVGFFAGSETAYLSVSRIKMRRLIQEKKRNSKVAARLKDRIDELLTVVLIGTNFMNSLASSLATALAMAIVGDGGIGVATVLITFFATTFGQIIPKTVAGVYPENVACKNAVILNILEKALKPLVWFFTKISKGAGEVAQRLWKSEGALVTEEELKALFEVGTNEGTLEKNEQVMLNKIFHFGDLSVYNVMKNRAVVKSLPYTASRNEVLKMFCETGLSMIPVYEGTKDQIIGVIHYKSVLLSDPSKICVNYASSVMKGVMFVPETFTAFELLSKFKKERSEFAVVLDEQGCTAGVVTTDDLLRVVFGRMTEEDAGNMPAELRVKLVGPDEFIVPGDMKIDDVNDVLKLDLESEEWTTLGGWLLERFGNLPSAGEVLQWNRHLFIIEDQAQRRILSVRIKLKNR